MYLQLSMGTANNPNYIEKILNDIKKEEFYENQILHIERFDKKPPVYGKLNHLLHDKIESWLKDNEIELYSHQAEAIDSILDKNNTIIVTSTASGKSLTYNIPVIQSLLSEPDSTFLYIFPTKALSQDQYTKLLEMFEYFEIPKKYIGIYDGDTPQEEKQRIRSESRLIITNPYGLHYYLPYRNLWIRFLKNLKYVVIDECHTYRGVFGSNFAQVIRRLMRIMKSYQKAPLFILSSATVKNSKEIAVKLTGQSNYTIVDKDGSPNPGRFFVLWDLPMYLGTDVFKSAHNQTRAIFNYIVKNRLQTLCFTTSRKMAELNAFYSKIQLKHLFDEQQTKEDLSERIMSYRAGISPSDRRSIEKNLREKYYLGVYTTNALELGVDIGSLDGTILSGFPGTISSMWQQVGRAGRKYNPNSGIESISFLIPMPDPLHLYYVRHHEELLAKPHETCNINLENPYILKNHLKCAANEAPLSESEQELFGLKFNEIVQSLESEGVIKKKGTKYFYNSTDTFPPKSVNLSGISDADFKVILNKEDGTSVITYQEQGYVFKELHKGAIYLYMAEPYIVQECDLEKKVVTLSPTDGKTFTDSMVVTDIKQIVKADKSRVESGINIYYGSVIVQETVIGYDIKLVDTGEKIAHEDLDMPPINLDTKAVWFSIPPVFIEKIESQQFDFNGAIHAIEHAAISMAPYFTMCDRWDIGGVSTRAANGTEVSGWPVIYIYDGFPGGIGITESLYDIMIELLEKTLELISTCKCKEKCPGCVMSPKCGNNNEPLDKHGAVELLRLLLKK